MSDEDNDDKRSPLEQSLNLPSIDDINENFNNEAIEASKDDDSNEDGLYIEDFENFGWDESEMDLDPEALKKQIAETQSKIKQLKEQKRHEQHLKSYHKDVDDIHTKAMDKFEEIMSVALTMEANAGSKYLASATKLLDIALSAKNAGMDREIEMAKLQLRKEKQDYEMYRKNPRDIEGGPESSDGESDDDDGDGETFDRNALVHGFSNNE